jgi:UDP-N-acetylglucosamine 1-carboxyvinyltransferase
MDMLIIRGGRPLRGRVAVSGSKNAALPIMSAALAVDGPCRLHNVPDLADVRTLMSLLGTLGVDCKRATHEAIELTPSRESTCVADYDLVRRMRAGVCVLGPLLARHKRACVSLPGGCNIGHRPIDLHLKGLRALGAQIRIERGYVVAEADRLVGANIYLGGPFGSTVTGTCNVMSAAALAEGMTTIEAAACEPEVVDLGQFLIAAGARITGLGTPTIRIEGVPRLHGCEHTIIPDRIEAATLMMAGAITRGDIEVSGADASHLTSVIEVLREIGIEIRLGATTLHVDGRRDLRSAECVALPFPAIPTDVQAQLSALLTTADGISLVTDKVFPDRFMHLSELARMGARIRREGASAIISGPMQLSGASVMASDLRASAALVLAALAADGPSVVRRIYHLDRGYEQLEVKLRSLGADVERVEDIPANVPAEFKDWTPVASEPGMVPEETSIPAPHWRPVALPRVTPQA